MPTPEKLKQVSIIPTIGAVAAEQKAGNKGFDFKLDISHPPQFPIGTRFTREEYQQIDRDIHQGDLNLQDVLQQPHWKKFGRAIEVNARGMRDLSGSPAVEYFFHSGLVDSLTQFTENEKQLYRLKFVVNGRRVALNKIPGSTGPKLREAVTKFVREQLGDVKDASISETQVEVRRIREDADDKNAKANRTQAGYNWTRQLQGARTLEYGGQTIWEVAEKVQLEKQLQTLKAALAYCNLLLSSETFNKSDEAALRGLSSLSASNPDVYAVFEEFEKSEHGYWNENTRQKLNAARKLLIQQALLLQTYGDFSFLAALDPTKRIQDEKLFGIPRIEYDTADYKREFAAVKNQALKLKRERLAAFAQYWTPVKQAEAEGKLREFKSDQKDQAQPYVAAQKLGQQLPTLQDDVKQGLVVEEKEQKDAKGIPDNIARMRSAYEAHLAVKRSLENNQPKFKNNRSLIYGMESGDVLIVQTENFAALDRAIATHLEDSPDAKFSLSERDQKNITRAKQDLAQAMIDKLTIAAERGLYAPACRPYLFDERGLPITKLDEKGNLQKLTVEQQLGTVSDELVLQSKHIAEFAEFSTLNCSSEQEVMLGRAVSHPGGIELQFCGVPAGGKRLVPSVFVDAAALAETKSQNYIPLVPYKEGFFGRKELSKFAQQRFDYFNKPNYFAEINLAHREIATQNQLFQQLFDIEAEIAKNQQLMLFATSYANQRPGGANNSVYSPQNFSNSFAKLFPDRNALAAFLEVDPHSLPRYPITQAIVDQQLLARIENRQLQLIKEHVRILHQFEQHDPYNIHRTPHDAPFNPVWKDAGSFTGDEKVGQPGFRQLYLDNYEDYAKAVRSRLHLNNFTDSSLYKSIEREENAIAAEEKRLTDTITLMGGRFGPQKNKIVSDKIKQVLQEQRQRLDQKKLELARTLAKDLPKLIDDLDAKYPDDNKDENAREAFLKAKNNLFDLVPKDINRAQRKTLIDEVARSSDFIFQFVKNFSTNKYLDPRVGIDLAELGKIEKRIARYSTASPQKDAALHLIAFIRSVVEGESNIPEVGTNAHNVLSDVFQRLAIDEPWIKLNQHGRDIAAAAVTRAYDLITGLLPSSVMHEAKGDVKDEKISEYNLHLISYSDERNVISVRGGSTTNQIPNVNGKKIDNALNVLSTARRWPEIRAFFWRYLKTGKLPLPSASADTQTQSRHPDGSSINYLDFVSHFYLSDLKQRVFEQKSEKGIEIAKDIDTAFREFLTARFAFLLQQFPIDGSAPVVRGFDPSQEEIQRDNAAHYSQADQVVFKDWLIDYPENKNQNISNASKTIKSAIQAQIQTRLDHFVPNLKATPQKLGNFDLLTQFKPVVDKYGSPEQKALCNRGLLEFHMHQSLDEKLGERYLDPNNAIRVAVVSDERRPFLKAAPPLETKAAAPPETKTPSPRLTAMTRPGSPGRAPSSPRIAAGGAGPGVPVLPETKVAPIAAVSLAQHDVKAFQEMLKAYLPDPANPDSPRQNIEFIWEVAEKWGSPENKDAARLLMVRYCLSKGAANITHAFIAKLKGYIQLEAKQDIGKNVCITKEGKLILERILNNYQDHAGNRTWTPAAQLLAREFNSEALQKIRFDWFNYRYNGGLVAPGDTDAKRIAASERDPKQFYGDNLSSVYGHIDAFFKSELYKSSKSSAICQIISAYLANPQFREGAKDQKFNFDYNNPILDVLRHLRSEPANASEVKNILQYLTRETIASFSDQKPDREQQKIVLQKALGCVSYYIQTLATQRAVPTEAQLSAIRSVIDIPDIIPSNGNAIQKYGRKQIADITSLIADISETRKVYNRVDRVSNAFPFGFEFTVADAKLLINGLSKEDKTNLASRLKMVIGDRDSKEVDKLKTALEGLIALLQNHDENAALADNVNLNKIFEYTRERQLHLIKQSLQAQQLNVPQRYTNAKAVLRELTDAVRTDQKDQSAYTDGVIDRTLDEIALHTQRLAAQVEDHKQHAEQIPQLVDDKQIDEKEIGHQVSNKVAAIRILASDLPATARAYQQFNAFTADNLPPARQDIKVEDVRLLAKGLTLADRQRLITQIEVFSKGAPRLEHGPLREALKAIINVLSTGDETELEEKIADYQQYRILRKNLENRDTREFSAQAMAAFEKLKPKYNELCKQHIRQVMHTDNAAQYVDEKTGELHIKSFIDRIVDDEKLRDQADKVQRANKEAYKLKNEIYSDEKGVLGPIKLDEPRTDDKEFEDISRRVAELGKQKQFLTSNTQNYLRTDIISLTVRVFSKLKDRIDKTDVDDEKAPHSIKAILVAYKTLLETFSKDQNGSYALAENALAKIHDAVAAADKHCAKLLTSGSEWLYGPGKSDNEIRKNLIWLQRSMELLREFAPEKAHKWEQRLAEIFVDYKNHGVAERSKVTEEEKIAESLGGVRKRYQYEFVEAAIKVSGNAELITQLDSFARDEKLGGTLQYKAKRKEESEKPALVARANKLADYYTGILADQKSDIKFEGSPPSLTAELAFILKHAGKGNVNSLAKAVNDRIQKYVNMIVRLEEPKDVKQISKQHSELEAQIKLFETPPSIKEVYSAFNILNKELGLKAEDPTIVIQEELTRNVKTFLSLGRVLNDVALKHLSLDLSILLAIDDTAEFHELIRERVSALYVEYIVTAINDPSSLRLKQIESILNILNNSGLANTPNFKYTDFEQLRASFKGLATSAQYLSVLTQWQDKKAIKEYVERYLGYVSTSISDYSSKTPKPAADDFAKVLAAEKQLKKLLATVSFAVLKKTLPQAISVIKEFNAKLLDVQILRGDDTIFAKIDKLEDDTNKLFAERQLEITSQRLKRELQGEEKAQSGRNDAASVAWAREVERYKPFQKMAANRQRELDHLQKILSIVKDQKLLEPINPATLDVPIPSAALDISVKLAESLSTFERWSSAVKKEEHPKSAIDNFLTELSLLVARYGDDTQVMTFIRVLNNLKDGKNYLDDTAVMQLNPAFERSNFEEYCKKINDLQRVPLESERLAPSVAVADQKGADVKSILLPTRPIDLRYIVGQFGLGKTHRAPSLKTEAPTEFLAIGSVEKDIAQVMIDSKVDNETLKTLLPSFVIETRKSVEDRVHNIPEVKDQANDPKSGKRTGLKLTVIAAGKKVIDALKAGENPALSIHEFVSCIKVVQDLYRRQPGEYISDEASKAGRSTGMTAFLDNALILAERLQHGKNYNPALAKTLETIRVAILNYLEKFGPKLGKAGVEKVEKAIADPDQKATIPDLESEKFNDLITVLQQLHAVELIAIAPGDEQENESFAGIKELIASIKAKALEGKGAYAKKLMQVTDRHGAMLTDIESALGTFKELRAGRSPGSTPTATVVRHSKSSTRQ